MARQEASCSVFFVGRVCLGSLLAGDHINPARATELLNFFSNVSWENR